MNIQSHDTILELQEIKDSVNQKEYSPPLFRLPRELRFQIYEYLIPAKAQVFRFYPGVGRTSSYDDTWDHFHTFTKICEPQRLSKHHKLEIMRTCRKIYFEVSGLIYSRCLFHFICFSYAPVVAFLRRIGPTAKSQIKRIRLSLVGQPPEVECEYHELFCTYLYEELPILSCLTADPWIWTA